MIKVIGHALYNLVIFDGYEFFVIPIIVGLDLDYFGL